MKKVLVILLILLSLTLPGCSNESINYSTGTYHDRSFNNDTFVVNYDILMIDTEETATAVAKSILSGLHSRGYVTKFHLSDIFHDTENDIWIVTCKPKNLNSAGTYFNFALDSKTGAVIETWHS